MLLSQAISNLQNLTKKKITYEQVGKVLGISNQAVSNRIQRNVELKDFEWDKLQEHFAKQSDTNLENVKIDILEKRLGYLEQQDDFQADYYPGIFGSCGNGVFALSEAKEKISVPKTLVKSYSTHGDSMLPYIHDKDLLVVEKFELGDQIQDNRIYVFCIDDKIFIKRLALNINQLIIKSDNKEYDTIKLELQENTNFQIVGKIVGLMRVTD